MRVQWIADPESLAALAQRWDELAAVDTSPFSRHAWVMCWWHAFRPRGRLRACLVWDGEELAAAIPLELSRGRLGAAANEQTPAFRPLAREHQARRRLAEALVASGRAVELRALPAEEPEAAAFVSDLASAGARTLVEPDFVSPIADTTGAFEDYRQALKGGWRELERRGRKLRREREVEETLVATPDDFEAELEEGLALEEAGWKGQTATAMLSSPATAGFYRRLARTFHASGELCLSSLRVDGRLVAFDLALLHRERYFLLKTAFDESMRSFAPGLVLRRAVIERCFELGLEAHEFLGADMEWKRLFSTGERRHAVLGVYPPRPRPRFAYAYRRALRPQLKRMYLRLRGS